MTSHDDWSLTVGDVTVRLTHIGGRRRAMQCSIPSRTWRRAAAVVDRLGVERALVELDARADRALDRGLVTGACRWRDVMVAIHAMSREDRFDGDTDH